ncbi:MAG: hypothetical protein ACOCXT_03035 [Candidatus Dojkabacteria bacterium]
MAIQKTKTMLVNIFTFSYLLVACLMITLLTGFASFLTAKLYEFSMYDVHQIFFEQTTPFPKKNEEPEHINLPCILDNGLVGRLENG